MFVQDLRALRGALRRLQLHNDAVIFHNAEGSFKIMLRNDPSEALDREDDAAAAAAMGWDLSIVWDPDAGEDAGVARLAELEPDGYVDEPGTFVVDSGSVNLADDSDPELQRAMSAVNKLHATTVCPCGKYLIKDGEASCIVCHLTAAPGDLREHFCAICQSDGAKKHMRVQQCCAQMLHERCLASWKDAGNTSCPLCRAMP